MVPGSASASSAGIDVIDLNVNEPKVTGVAWMDIAIGSSPAQRVEVSLYGDVVQHTVANFEALCRSPNCGEGYKGSIFFRVISEFRPGGAKSDKLTD